jgi:glycosyltransferase involved in cell wall biosynthesis
MLTVFIATKNRAAILRQVLAAFCRIEAPVGGWKLVVVDNGSNDATAQILGEFASQLPLQAVTEPTPGKNSALNTGLQFLEGDVAVFADDDAFPRPDWLTELRRAADSQPECSMFGGAIVPRWESDPPSWVNWVDQGVVYSLTNPTRQRGPMPAYFAFGPNMAIRSSIFAAGARFDCSIGPRGRSYPMGSETDFLMKLSRRGYQTWYVPEAVVEHFIREEQLSKTWVLRRAIHFGRGQCRLRFAEALDKATERKEKILPLLWGIFKQTVLMGAAAVLFRQEALFRRHWKLNVLRGWITEAGILSREQSGSVSRSTLSAVASKD